MSETTSTAAQTRAVFLISVLGLFLELMLIRWIATEIRIFAYLQNTVLVVCFLGLGMGCFTCRRPVRMGYCLASLLVITVGLAIPSTRRTLASTSRMLSVLEDFVIWSPARVDDPTAKTALVLLGLGITLMLMLLIWAMFIPVGRKLGRLLADHPHTLWAYSVNVAGSLAGTWLFVWLSAFQQPPIVWFAVFGVLMLFFLGNSAKERGVNFALTVAIIGLSWFCGQEPNSLEVRWSPYQKLALFPAQGRLDQDLMVTVNNSGYQAMIDLRPETIKANSEAFQVEGPSLSQYDLPAQIHPRPQKVLIVGAGSGNDVAGILRNSPHSEITAVEIDPVIVAMGRRHHPERPYDSENVRVIVDDARSYFARADEKYDLICFGLLDSHTTSAVTNAR